MEATTQPSVGEGLKIFDRLPLKPGESKLLEGMLLVMCHQGTISAMIDQIRKTLHPDCVMVLRPGRRIKNVSTSDDFEGFFVYATEAKLNEMLPSLKIIKYAIQYEQTPMIQAQPDEASTLRALYKLLKVKIKRLEFDAPYCRESLRSLCELMFFDTLSLYSSHLEKVVKISRHDETLSTFMELVENNFNTERRISFYAQKLCLTPKHLSKVIKSASGHTASDVIATRVISEARFMLKNSCLNVQEIANALHFKTQSFFGKYFKAHCGLSPSEFRSSIQKSLETE